MCVGVCLCVYGLAFFVVGQIMYFYIFIVFFFLFFFFFCFVRCVVSISEAVVSCIYFDRKSSNCFLFEFVGFFILFCFLLL